MFKLFYIYTCGFVRIYISINVCARIYAQHTYIYLYFISSPPLLWEGVLVLAIRASNRCRPPTQSPCFSPLFSVPRWERHGEALCGARSADEGALHVKQDGLAVTACLSWRGGYDEEFLQSWPPQGTAEFLLFHLPSSQTVRGDQLVRL